MPTQSPEAVAAVDLGSNSFHMIVGRVINGELRTQDRLRERVRIAGGLDPEGEIDEQAQQRGLECLGRFRERLRGLPEDCVRAVGTSTFRRASNVRQFLRRAEEVLGHPIEVVSGQEEARLVYLGVAHNVPPEPARRLVIDIGGGSTECILGEGFDVIRAESRELGCVRYSQEFFPQGLIERDAFDRAVIAARLELPDAGDWVEPFEWDLCLGASGTAHAVRSILRESGWATDGITLDGLRRLRKALLAVGRAEAVDLPGLGTDRKAVLPGGLAILTAVFETFELTHMTTAPGGLREGLLFDLFGRFRHEDVRERTVRNFMQRYHVDDAKARRVERTALGFLGQAQAWRLDEPHGLRRLLGWAARLHEIGLAISHNGFHKHGEFLIANSDMPGFSNDEQRIMAALVRSQRSRIPTRIFADLPHVRPKQALRLCILLRLAVLLNRSHAGRTLPPIGIEVEKNTVRLRTPTGWLDEHPLTRADLKAEAAFAAPAGYTIDVTG
ncbi:MAG: exopolyphosphatase [Planctomycetota bacterium]